MVVLRITNIFWGGTWYKMFENHWFRVNKKNGMTDSCLSQAPFSTQRFWVSGKWGCGLHVLHMTEEIRKIKIVLNAESILNICQTYSSVICIFFCLFWCIWRFKGWRGTEAAISSLRLARYCLNLTQTTTSPCCVYVSLGSGSRYKDALGLLLREVLNRIQFRYNQAQLEELDDEALDDDVRLCHFWHTCCCCCW